MVREGVIYLDLFLIHLAVLKFLLSEDQYQSLG